MTIFRSNEEFFRAVRDLIAQLEARGHTQASAGLQAGFACLNGLTDGSARFLEEIRQVESSHAETLAPDERKALERIRKAAHEAVHR